MSANNQGASGGVIAVPQNIVLIAAVARNGVIGSDNELVFKEPLDQKHFRSATMGCPVVMGRKTWDSLPERFRPLPGRRNVVVSRNAALRAPGADVAVSLDAALAVLADAPKVFVIGGEQLYVAALPRATDLLLTEVDADLPGNVHFPDWDRSAFDLLSSQAQLSQAGLPFAFKHYRRRSAR